jgi:outer membrane protein
MKNVNLYLLNFNKSMLAILSILFVFGLQSVSAQQKNGHINSDAVFAVMPEVKNAQATIEALNKTRTIDLNKIKAEIQSKYDLGVAKNKTLSEVNKDMVMKELQALNDELDALKKHLEEAAQKAQQDITTKEAELFTPINARFMNAAKLVTKEKGLSYVFDVSQQRNSNLLIFDDGIDITDAVKTKLGNSIAPVAVKKN